MEKIAWKASIFSASLTIVGALFYLLFRLNLLTSILALIMAIAMTIIIKVDTIKVINIKPKKTDIIILILFIITTIGLFCYTILNASDLPINSPWKILDYKFWTILFLNTGLYLYLIIKTNFKSLATSLYFLFIFSIGAIIYKLGYGFDSFIHLASLEIIAKTGTIAPKTIYYAGEYGLVIPLAKVTTIKIIYFSKFLLAFLAALILPGLSNKKVGLALLPIITFGIFTVLLPQNLGYFFLLLTVLIIASNQKHKLIIAGIMAIAAFFCHPLAGIPALTLILINLTNKKLIRLLIIIGTISIIPLAFLLTHQAQLNAFNPTILDILKNLEIPVRENWLLNFIYLLGFNVPIIVIFLGFWGRKNSNKTYYLLSFAMVITAILVSFLKFNLIDYEQGEFAKRILISAAILLIPAMINGLERIYHGVIKLPKIQIITMAIIATALLTAAVYLSYPRNDVYETSHGISASKFDLEAVRTIARNTNQRYLVLANQQTSVIALKEFNFQGYLKNDIYFYPIPTASPLYQYYLKMTYEQATRKTMENAMELVDVNEGYLIINKYWTDSQKIIAEAQLDNDGEIMIGNNDLYIFKYIKKEAVID